MNTYIDCFKNIKNSTIEKSIDISEVLNLIKNGDIKTNKQIALIRFKGKEHPSYPFMKEQLPTFRFNFNFNQKALNDNIIGATGFIYIDVDNSTKIKFNTLIYAYWKSVSNTGLGILVKVNGLTKDNFADTYNAISLELGLKTDDGARKATQQTVLSYDNELYLNEKSITFYCTNQDENKKVSYSSKQRERRLIEVDDTFLEEENIRLRFNTINDYFIDDTTKYIVFEGDKEAICIPFIPQRIEEGNRNKTMFYYLSQIALMNPLAGKGLLTKIANTINDRFIVKYHSDKITSIVTAVIKKRQEETLELYNNKERRIIFNPNIKLTKTEKLQIVAKEMGRLKTDKTKNEIYSIVEGWDFNNGKIDQNNVAKITGKSIATIKRNWRDVKDLAKSMNKDFKGGINDYKVKDEVDIVKEEIVSENEDMGTPPPLDLSTFKCYKQYLKNDEVINVEVKETKTTKQMMKEIPPVSEDEYKTFYPDGDYQKYLIDYNNK